jgi:hypothetical protein
MKRLSLIAGLLLFPAPLLAATEVTADLGEDRNLDFGLRFASRRNSFDYGGTAYDTTVKWVSAGWREPFGPVQLGLRVGYSSLTQNGNPATQGLELDGYHAGISLALDIARYRQGRIFLSADYLYQIVKHEGTTQSIELSWHDPRVNAGLYHGLGHQVFLFAGGSYGRTSGTERVENGAITARHFSRNDSGAFLGLDITDNGKGTVGFVVRHGLDRGGSIYFKRLF